MAQIGLENLVPRYMFLDPAGGKKAKQAIKGTRARSAIIVCGTDVLGRAWVLDAWAERGSTNTVRKAYLDLYEQWSPITIAGFEDLGQQSLLEDPLIDEALERGIQELPLVAVTPTTKAEKNFRIRSILQRFVGGGRLMIREDLLELIDEITSFPMNTQKDLIDALASCLDLIPRVEMEQDKYDEAQELAHYLRESGIPPREIERRVAELGLHQDAGAHTKWWDRLTAKRKISY